MTDLWIAVVAGLILGALLVGAVDHFWPRNLPRRIRASIARDAERNLAPVRFAPRVFTAMPPDRGVIE